MKTWLFGLVLAIATLGGFWWIQQMAKEVPGGLAGTQGDPGVEPSNEAELRVVPGKEERVVREVESLTEPSVPASVPGELLAPVAPAGFPLGQIVKILVVDTNGVAQVDYPVKLWSQGTLPKGRRNAFPEVWPYATSDRIRLVSDKQGLVVAGIPIPYISGEAGKVQSLHVASELAWELALEQQFDLPKDLSKPIRFVVQPSGKVQIQINDPEGQPWRLGYSVDVLVGDGDFAKFRSERAFRFPVATAKISSSTWIQHLPLNQTLQFYIEPKAEMPTLDLTLEKLTADDPSQTLVGSLFYGGPGLKVRFLLPDGVPLAFQAVSFEAKGRSPLKAITDGTGATLFQLKHNKWTSGRFSAALYGKRADHSLPISWARSGPGDVVDFGELVLFPEPVLVAGKLWMPNGRPANSCELAVKIEHEVLGVHHRNIRTNGQGGFQLFGDPERTRVTIQTKHPLLHGSSAYVLAEPVAFRAGKTHLQLKLVQAAQLRGTVLPGRSTRVGEGLELCLHYSEARTVRIAITEAGTFWSESLIPGEVEAHVVRIGEHEPLATISGLILQPGRQVDPRLQDIPLH